MREEAALSKGNCWRCVAAFFCFALYSLCTVAYVEQGLWLWQFRTSIAALVYWLPLLIEIGLLAWRVNELRSPSTRTPALESIAVCLGSSAIVNFFIVFLTTPPM